MKSLFNTFFFRLAAFTALLLAVNAYLQKNLQSAYENTRVLITWFFFLTAVVHFILEKMGRNDAKKFIRAFMTTVTIRFLLHMMIIFIWSFLNHNTAVAFIITYFILYLCYTIFEILGLIAAKRIK